MSRSNKKQNNNAAGALGCHPQENIKEHRQFLIRSLERNDEDLSLLNELNRTLRNAKESILLSCGELVLLDLGAGRLTLVNDELHQEMKNNKSSVNCVRVDETAHHLSPAQKELCVDFLLRMKLRRKLSNRLIRRLNRVAHAMDGGDVVPPPPPRYGDLRLHIDSEEVRAKVEHWKRQAEAKARIRKAKSEYRKKQKELEAAKLRAKQVEDSRALLGEAMALKAEEEMTLNNSEETKNREARAQLETSGSIIEPTPMEIDSSSVRFETNTRTENKQSPDMTESFSNTIEGKLDTLDPPLLEDEYELLKEFETAYEKVWDPVQQRMEYTLSKEEIQPDYLAIKNGTGIGATAKILSEQEREAEHKKWATALLGRIPDQPTLEELGLKNRVFCFEERRKRCLEADEDDEDKIDAEDDSNNKKAKVDSGSEGENEFSEKDESHAEDAPPSHVHASQKVAGKELRRKSSDEDKMNDSEEQEKPNEEVTAETEPETENLAGDDGKLKDDGDDEADDDDDSSDLFKAEEDDDDDDDDDDDEGPNTEESKQEESDDESSDLFGDDGDEQEQSFRNNGFSQSAQNIGTSQDNNTLKGPDNEGSKKVPPPSEEIEKSEEKKVEDPPKRMRPMSLVPVPSFYEQDMTRIKLIHGDLLASSILEHARRRVAEVTNDYNNAFSLSNQLFEQKTMFQQQLAFFLAKSRTELAKANSEHALKVAIEKQRWIKQKQEHDMKRIKAALPSNWGRQPFGTSLTQTYMRNPGVAGIIGTCVADIVDGAIMIGEGKLMNPKFEDFKPPPVPVSQNGETLAQQHLRVENELRMKFNETNKQFEASEEERKKAWRKMMKAKAELETPQQQVGGSKKVKVDLLNYHQIPVPPLRNSTQQVLPDYSRAAKLASYTPPSSTSYQPQPPQSPGGEGGTSDSKYSAARVRERISSDGTVAPVTEPKKTKDGLYQRPAGRTRKGMQWDALRGIWVPEGSQ